MHITVEAVKKILLTGLLYKHSRLNAILITNVPSSPLLSQEFARELQEVLKQLQKNIHSMQNFEVLL